MRDKTNLTKRINFFPKYTPPIYLGTLCTLSQQTLDQRNVDRWQKTRIQRNNSATQHNKEINKQINNKCIYITIETNNK